MTTITQASSSGRGMIAVAAPVEMPVTRSQFASRVVNFSSQYGRNGSHTYTAANLAGPRIIEDKYGDFTEAFVLVNSLA